MDKTGMEKEVWEISRIWKKKGHELASISINNNLRTNIHALSFSNPPYPPYFLCNKVTINLYFCHTFREIRTRLILHWDTFMS